MECPHKAWKPNMCVCVCGGEMKERGMSWWRSESGMEITAGCFSSSQQWTTGRTQAQTLTAPPPPHTHTHTHTWEELQMCSFTLNVLLFHCLSLSLSLSEVIIVAVVQWWTQMHRAVLVTHHTGHEMSSFFGFPSVSFCVCKKWHMIRQNTPPTIDMYG